MNVPLAEPKSSINNLPDSTLKRACRRDTDVSSMIRSFPCARPTDTLG